MKNKKVITVVVCTIIVFILVRACTNALNKQIRNDIEKETIKIVSNEFAKDWHASIGDLLSEDIDFDEFPLSINFRNKYKNIQDIFGRSGKEKYIFENSYFDSYDESMSNIITIIYKTENNFEEIAYQLHYIINENNELDDIEILESRVYREEDGHYPRYIVYDYYYNDPSGNTWVLCHPYVRLDRGRDYDRVYVTDNFLKKFPNYLTTGITGDTDYMMFGKTYQDKNNDKVCYSEFLGLEWTKTYKLTYDIDEKGYINDVIVELYEKHKTEDPEYLKSYYKEYENNVGND